MGLSMTTCIHSVDANEQVTNELYFSSGDIYDRNSNDLELFEVYQKKIPELSLYNHLHSQRNGFKPVLLSITKKQSVEETKMDPCNRSLDLDSDTEASVLSDQNEQAILIKKSPAPKKLNLSESVKSDALKSPLVVSELEGLEYSVISNSLEKLIEKRNTLGTEIFQNTKLQDGSTLLHIAAKFSNKDVVTFLLDCGIDINIRNKDGHTALYLAYIYSSNDEIIKAFIRAKAALFAASPHSPYRLSSKESKSIQSISPYNEIESVQIFSKKYDDDHMIFTSQHATTPNDAVFKSSESPGNHSIGPLLRRMSGSSSTVLSLNRNKSSPMGSIFYYPSPVNIGYFHSQSPMIKEAEGDPYPNDPYLDGSDPSYLESIQLTQHNVVSSPITTSPTASRLTASITSNQPPYIQRKNGITKKIRRVANRMMKAMRSTSTHHRTLMLQPTSQRFHI